MPSALPGTEGSYRAEVFRKTIHLTSLLIPVFYFFLTKENALKLLLPLTAIFLSVDIARYYVKPLQGAFMQTFGTMLRKHETDHKQVRLNGASFVLISATLCVILFPKFITLSSFGVLIISDLTAALIGKRFGKHPFFSKSLEGSLAFLLSGFIVILVTPKLGHQIGEYVIGFIAVAVGMVVEALSIKIDDNLSIPLSVGAVIWLLYFLFLPSLNLYQLG